MYTVMIRDNMSPVARKIMEETGQINVVVDNDKATGTPQALAEIVNEVDGLALRSGTKVPAEVLAKAQRLKVIGRAGIGVDNIDVRAATQQGVVVMNAPGGNTVTTGEHAISLMLALARNIPQGTSSIRAGRWDKKKLIGVEITGKTLGIIGFGRIGRVVAERARGLKMRVLASDPYVSTKAAQELGVELVPIETLLEQSDFISLHVPSLKETIDFVNADLISRMKPGIRIVNCARGNVINLEDLYQALEQGHVAGAALDVFPKEPPDTSLHVLQHPHVILTPHLGASTGEAQEKVAEMIARQMAAYLLEGVITNAVNFPSLSQEAMDKLRPYLDLSERLGSLLGQLVRQHHDIDVIYSGEVARMEIRPLTHAVLKGFLGAHTDTPVNYVSAPSIARAKGMNFTETVTDETGDYTSLIQVKLQNSDNETLDEVWGTLFGRCSPRVVKMGQIRLDAIPEGYMIVIQNIDKPGVIGNIGSTLGRHQINIGRFQLGRLDDRACCMVNIDTAADESVLAEIKQLPNMLTVQQVHL